MTSIAGSPGWLSYTDPTSGRPYYHHQASDTTQWEHPLSESTHSFAIWVVMGCVALVPVVLYLVAALRRAYLAQYHPDLLILEQRNARDRAAKRQARSSRMKYRRPRFKVSQDGKGGRSANS
mmetsp:Transcript_33778/g.95589  ORF Transcript_33778/g.95589 Transcript_33778/m.95589 type:complete len:122 (+) Transcript_33778:579-944(+)